MACSAKSDQLVNHFISAVRICSVMDMLNRVFSASLANSVFPLYNCNSLFLPSATCKIFVILLFAFYVYALFITHNFNNKKPATLLALT